MRAPMHWPPTCAATSAHEPVLARPDSKAYRLRKLAAPSPRRGERRAAVVFALLAGATVALWQAREARLQRDAALQAKAQAEHAERVATAETDLSDFLLMEMSGARRGDELAAPLERARKMFDAQYRDEPALRGRLLLHLGGLFNGRNDVARARALWAEAEPLLREHGEWSALAELQCFGARDLAREGEFDKARATIAEAAQWLARAAAPPDAPTRRDCLASEGVVELVAGNPARASTLLEDAVAMEERAGRAEQGTLIELLNQQARIYVVAGRYREAVQTARRTEALVERLGLDHTTHRLTARRMEAMALRDGGRALDALALQASTDVASSPRLSERGQYVLTLLQLGRLDGLAPRVDELVAMSRTLGPIANREVRLIQAEALTDLGRLREAGAALADAEELFGSLRAAKRYAAHRLPLVQAHWALASGDLARAQGAIDEARAVVAATGQRDDPAWHRIHQLQARVHLASDRGADALKAADEALDWSQRHAVDADGSLHVADDRMLRAQAQRMLGHVDIAHADAALAERHARAAGGDDHPLVRFAHAESLR